MRVSLAPSPDTTRMKALTDITNLGRGGDAGAPPSAVKPMRVLPTARTPCAKVYNSAAGPALDTPEVFFDAAETPRVTPNDELHAKPFDVTPPAARAPPTPVLATPDARLLTNAAAEEALTAACGGRAEAIRWPWLTVDDDAAKEIKNGLRLAEIGRARRWIAAQTAEIEALRALVQRQRQEKESLITVGAAPRARRADMSLANRGDATATT